MEFKEVILTEKKDLEDIDPSEEAKSSMV